MEFLNKYEPKHYSNYIEVVDNYFCKNYMNKDSFNDWVKSLKERDIITLNKTMNFMIKNDEKYFEECAKLLTLIIRLFMLELDRNYNSIQLNNKEIKKIVYRFKKIIQTELVFRKTNTILDLKEPKPYSLLSDMYKKETKD